MVNTRTCSSPQETASTSEGKSTSGKKMKQTRLSFASKGNVSSPDMVRKRKLSSPETEQDRTVKIVRREGSPDPDPEPIEVIDDDDDKDDASPAGDTDTHMVEILSCDDSNSVSVPAATSPENETDNPLNESVTVDGNSSNCTSASEDPDKTAPDSSLVSSLEPPTNTNGKPLTPRQLEKFVEKKQRHEERLRQKLEREKKLEDERRQREDRERQKKKEREEREELKRKEKEEKEAARVREKEEKETARLKEKEEKETARLKEKEDRERKRQLESEQKNEEKRRREEQREEDRRKKEEEKRNKELEEEQKRKKAAQAFTKFFKVGAKTEEDKSVPGAVAGNAGQFPSSAKIVDVEVVNQNFMPFEVKGDMKLAPTVRRVLNVDARSALEMVFQETKPVHVLYLKSLKTKSHVPLKGTKTLVSSEASDDDSDDDLMVVDDERVHKVEETKTKEKYRAKCLMFHENRRPAYYGTWQKKSKVVGPRNPFAKDEKHFDYEVESDDEWEEEEPGESLHGSDDEKDKESEDDYEVDNDFFVPHGHLSDEEMQNADEPEDNSPEAQKVKLKLLQDEFNDEMKKKTEKIKPRLIGCIWANEAGGKPDNCPAVFWELLQFRAVLSAGPIQLRPPPEAEASGDEDADAEDNAGDKRKGQRLTEEEVRHLIRLVHGNLNSCKFVVKEFQVFREKAETSATVSNLSILRKIKEIAKWETPPSFSCCWVVRKEILDQYELSELPLVNKWNYALTPKRTHENLKAAAAEKKQQLQNQMPSSPQVVTAAVQVDVPKTPVIVAPQKVSPPSANKKSTQNSIARFTKVLTTEEKQRQFQSIQISSPKQSTSTNTNTPNENRAPIKQKLDATVGVVKSETVKVSPGVTSSSSSSIGAITEVAAATKTNGAVTGGGAKKRVPLLMSVPRGQAISEQSKNLLIKNFLQKQPTEKVDDLKKLAASTAGGSGNPENKEPVVIASIVLD